MGVDKRKNYWNNDYVDYWKERVRNTNKMMDAKMLSSSNDPTTPDSRYIQLIDLLEIQSSDIVLEVGCGFGRSLPYLASKVQKVIGVDISSQMILESKKLTSEFKNIVLMVSESESMKIDSNSISKVVCFAAFDAMYQKEALLEFNRVCKINGKILITGKNNFFKNDDINALNAEIGAKEKNHPNFFTDVKSFLKHISLFGFKVIHQEFYLKRGDFAVDRNQKNFVDNFYEYTFVLKKINSISVNKDLIPIISNEHSKNYINRFNLKK